MHGYTEEELRVILAPMARSGGEPIGSMGTDSPMAVLSEKPRLMFDYFTQLFAQVTNPPLDAIREELVTSLGTIIGPEENLLQPESGLLPPVALPYPVIRTTTWPRSCTSTTRATCPASPPRGGRPLRPSGGGAGLAPGCRISAEVSAAIDAGARLIILSDRPVLQPTTIRSRRCC